MKKGFILLGLVLIMGCSGKAEPRRAYEAYLQAFRQGNFKTMWKSLSSEQQRRIENQVAILKSGKGVKILTRGLLEISEKDLARLTPEEYYVQVVTAYQKLLQEKKRAKEIFDLSAAHVKSVDLRDKLAIITVFDGANRRKVQMIKEKEGWKVDEEHVYLEEKEDKK